MKKIFYILFAVCLLTACSSDDNNADSEIPETPQNYTSFVIINKYDVAILNCVIGYRQSDRTIKKIVELGDINPSQESSEITVDFSNINKIMIFFDTWEGQEAEPNMALVKTFVTQDSNDKYYYNLSENRKNKIELSGFAEYAYKPYLEDYPH